MNIKQAKEEIRHTVSAYLAKNADGSYKIPEIRKRPVLLMGPPGIGKTQIMEQVAEECGIGLVSYTITHHTRQSAVGLPMIQTEEFDGRERTVTEYTMSEIIASVYRAIRDGGHREGILFIDEINCVSETLAPTMLQFLQCKTFGNQAVPEGWIIVAAGNPPEYNKSVREFDMVTLDRVRLIPVEADFTVWKEYAKAQKVHPALLSYLEIRPKNFYRVEADVDGIRYVTARGWEDFSCLLSVYEEQGITVTEDLVYEFLHHRDVAEDVAVYLELYRKYQEDYGIDDILAGRVRASVYARLLDAEFDERISVVNLLLDGVQNFMDRVARRHAKADVCYAAAKQAKEEKSADSDVVRAQFEAAKDALEEAEDQAGQALDHAFDFMEDAFGSGEEMVVFVTELTVSGETAAFLSENECEKYDRYHRELLIGTTKQQILSEQRR